MSERALIDLEHFDLLLLSDCKVGDTVGVCGGLVKGIDKAGVVVAVNPHPEICGGCSLSEYCTKSVAD